MIPSSLKGYDRASSDQIRSAGPISRGETVLFGEFAKRFRLDQVEENRLRKRLGPIANERDLLRNAGR
jgi:hypothetical protein